MNPSIDPQKFEKIYLEIFASNKRPPLISDLALSFDVITKPSYEFYRKWHDDIGRAWNWHLRPRINNRESIETELAHPLTEMALIKVDQKAVGYYLVVGETATDLELSDFGFLTEHINKGYGKVAMSKLLQSFFSRETNRIWLSTRSTNDARVPDFYKACGFSEYKREVIDG